MNAPILRQSRKLLSSYLKSGNLLVHNTRQFSSTGLRMSVTTVTLNGGFKMPLLGYGTWQANEKDLEDAVELALEAGYRHFDTAHAYENEKAIGKVLGRWLSAGKLKRDDIFLVTKVPPGGNRAESVPKYLKRSLEFLQVDYVDLYLVHVPFAFEDIEGDLHPRNPDGTMKVDLTTNHISLWKAMESQVDAGLARAIGISNFNKGQIERILQNSRIKPCSLQVELHLYFQQKDLVEFCKKNGIAVTAYSPLGSPGLAKFMAQFGHNIDLPDILSNPVVQAIAEKHERTEAQIALRHAIQKEIAVIPKSTNANRLRQNIDVFNFKLDDDDVKKLDGLDQGIRILDFSVFNGVKEHPEYPFK